MDILSHIHSL